MQPRKHENANGSRRRNLSNTTVRFWAAIVAVNAAGALLANIALGGVTWQMPWPSAVASVAISFLFSLCCSSLCIITLPRVAPTLSRRLAFPFNWAAIVVVLLVCASIGSLGAMLMLAAIGYIPVSAVISAWLRGPLKISIISTLLFGIFFTVVEMLRARLDAATVALRTKERDEAEARRLAAEAQLASIESRVQPHFLFNTLNSIAALVHDDPAGAERMTGQLASLLRSALDSTANPLVPLEEELRVVRAYLDIERVRFGDRLHYQVDLGNGAASAIVPRMALQTLVENSVKYAVSPRREGGSIRVRGDAASGRIRIAVEDDGPGFDSANRPAGHGLALLGGRLAMLFGDRASMHIDSRPGFSGVTIDLPNDAREDV